MTAPWQTLDMPIDAGHPAAEGHFPGNPIIPGAVLLDDALHALCKSMGETVSSSTLRTKFLHPVRPGDRVTVEFRNIDGEVEFIGRVGEVIVMKGEVDWRRNPKAA